MQHVFGVTGILKEVLDPFPASAHTSSSGCIFHPLCSWEDSQGMSLWSASSRGAAATPSHPLGPDTFPQLHFGPWCLSGQQLNVNSAMLSWFPSQRQCQELVAGKASCISLVL